MSSVTAETLETLPPGHPQAGYTAPAHDAVHGTGTVPDAEQQWYDDRVTAQQAENDAVAASEDAAAKADDEFVQPTKKSGSSSSSSSSSGS